MVRVREITHPRTLLHYCLARMAVIQRTQAKEGHQLVPYYPFGNSLTAGIDLGHSVVLRKYYTKQSN